MTWWVVGSANRFGFRCSETHGRSGSFGHQLAEAEGVFFELPGLAPARSWVRLAGRLSGLRGRRGEAFARAV